MALANDAKSLYWYSLKEESKFAGDYLAKVLLPRRQIKDSLHPRHQAMNTGWEKAVEPGRSHLTNTNPVAYSKS